MSFWRTYYHIIWTTKYRQPLISNQIEQSLYNYMIQRAAETEVYVYALNGWNDHVHLLATIPPKQAVADVVKLLKGASTHFVNHELRNKEHFAWQRGYGVLTCGERQRSFVEAYIHNQKQHHAEQTTNHWLEYVAETDEGPQLPATGPIVVREEHTHYDEPPI